MWRAIMPEFYKDALENEPARAAVFQNDCTYICYHLMTLGYNYQTKLATPVKETSTLVDMVPLFRKMGERVFRFQLVCQIIRSS